MLDIKERGKKSQLKKNKRRERGKRRKLKRKREKEKGDGREGEAGGGALIGLQFLLGVTPAHSGRDWRALTSAATTT